MPLQKDSWRTLVGKEEFSLIGEPLSEHHLIAIDQGTRDLLTAVGLRDVEFLLWVSGDYSAATDGLSLAISQLAMEEYLKARGISPGDDLWTIATKVLGAHIIDYGKEDPGLTEEEREKLPASYLMQNGQLMGSPLSFPVLCAINFVVYKTALRRFVTTKGGDWSKAEKLSLPVRVNGDDILFKCNHEFYHEFWKPAISPRAASDSV